MLKRLQRLFKAPLILLLLILNSVANASGPAAQSENEKLQGERLPKVVFISPGHIDMGFWSNVSAAMKAAADQLGFELEVINSDRQWLRMVRNAEAVINSPEKPDFLILVNEYQEGARLLALADKAGIRTLMLLNSLTAEQRSIYVAPGKQLKNWIASLIPNNEIAGYEMARSLVVDPDAPQSDELPPIALLTLSGDNNTPASEMRLKGLDRALADFPQLKERRRISVNLSGKAAFKRTRLWLASGEKLGAVWAANDEIALGAIKAIREAGLKPGIDVKIAGLNWSKEAILQVIKGEMTLTHGGHFLAGAWAIVMLYDIEQEYNLNAGALTVTREEHFPMAAINQRNAPAYLENFGDQQWSRIPFKNFSLTHTKNPLGYQFTLEKLLQSLHQPNHHEH